MGLDSPGWSPGLDFWTQLIGNGDHADTNCTFWTIWMITETLRLVTYFNRQAEASIPLSQ